MNLRRIARGSLLALLASVLVYAALAMFGDMRVALDRLADFPLSTLGAAVALTLVCYVLRAVRFWLLIRETGEPITLADAFYTQFGGITMTVSPGKVGEVLKAVLARDFGGPAVERGIAIVFSERLADLIAVVALSAGALTLLQVGWFTLAATAAVLVVGAAVLRSRVVNEAALRMLLKQKWMAQHHAAAGAASETLRTMLGLRVMSASVALGYLAWGSEGIAFALVLRALGFGGLGIAAAVAVYAMSTVAGALTMVPGGIGPAEASMAGILVLAGMGRADAAAATLLIRVVTLWFGVGLGWVVLASRPAVLKRLAGVTEE